MLILSKEARSNPFKHETPIVFYYVHLNVSPYAEDLGFWAAEQQEAPVEESPPDEAGEQGAEQDNKRVLRPEPKPNQQEVDQSMTGGSSSSSSSASGMFPAPGGCAFPGGVEVGCVKWRR